MMNQQSHQDNINSPPPLPPHPQANDLLAKRKRGRPRKDENSTPKPNDTSLVGKVVTGVIEGSFDAGYLLNVKVKDSDINLKGLVFIPGRVSPVTSETDVAPLAKMYEREEIKNYQTDHQSLLNDQPMRDATTDLEISESTRALALVPEVNNGEVVLVHTKEATVEKDEEQSVTRLVEFFPTTETLQVRNLVLVEKEKEQTKSHSGFDLMAEELDYQGEKVPEELQLELGNKTTFSGDNIITTSTETNHKTCVSTRSFIGNLFEREEKKVDDNMEEEEEEEEATPSVQ